jgi:aminopeptidase N
MICRTFWQREQDDVLQPYVERYFAAVEDISAARGIWAAKGSALRNNVLRDLFPQPRDLAGFVDKLDRWLAGRELADYVRRVIAERRDDTLRAVRCQSAVRAAS